VTARWEQGCRNGLQLWRELQTQGYKGGSRSVYRFLATLREGSAPTRGKAQRSQAVPESPVEPWTAQKAVWLFIRDPIHLEKKEHKALAAIRQASPTADAVYERDKDAVLAGLTLAQSNGVGDRKNQQIKAHQAYDVWPGRICTAAPAGASCSVVRNRISDEGMASLLFCAPGKLYKKRTFSAGTRSPSALRTS
jgi:hypothetical protein